MNASPRPVTRLQNSVMHLVKKRRGLFMMLVLVIAPASQAGAEIRFEETTMKAGIHHTGMTFGASWGDLNADGWPDLWVGNHATAPSLYLNQGDGTFIDVASQVLPAAPDSDAHGAAWADFDNDGDQDLIEVVGAGFGTGAAPNHFFVNQEGVLVESAARYGLDQPLARGRTPLWLDADRNGHLDVVLMNAPRPDGRAPSSLFRQGADGFTLANETFAFKQPGRTRVEKLYDLMVNVRHLRFGLPPILYGHEAFAQFTDLSGDGAPDLVGYGPMRVLAVDRVPFEDITYQMGFPTIRSIQDVAIEDFDGDQLKDMYLTRSYSASDVIQRKPGELRGSLITPSATNGPLGVEFKTAGPVRFEIHPRSTIRLSDISIGQGAHPEDRVFALTPDDPRLAENVPNTVVGGKVAIQYRGDDDTWVITSATKKTNFIVTSTWPIELVATPGFKPSKGETLDKLLMRRNADLVLRRLDGHAGIANACYSVVAADFDNDTDIDLYLACTGPVENVPNILLKNDGKGNFSLVPNAGGAAGNQYGRAESVVTADYDRDGFMDLFVANGQGDRPFTYEGPHQLFRNRGNDNHWIEVDLVGTVSNRDGIGAGVTVESGGVEQVRDQGGGMHRYSQNDQRLHFGLADQIQVDVLTVRWPSGIIQRLENVKADQILRVTEPESLHATGQQEPRQPSP